MLFRSDFANLANAKCKAAYEASAPWFTRLVRRGAGNAGRDTLYMFIRHWLDSYKQNPARLRRGVTRALPYTTTEET